jgi:hypothetical protein
MKRTTQQLDELWSQLQRVAVVAKLDVRRCLWWHWQIRQAGRQRPVVNYYPLKDKVEVLNAGPDMPSGSRKLMGGMAELVLLASGVPSPAPTRMDRPMPLFDKIDG